MQSVRAEREVVSTEREIGLDNGCAITVNYDDPNAVLGAGGQCVVRRVAVLDRGNNYLGDLCT